MKISAGEVLVPTLVDGSHGRSGICQSNIRAACARVFPTAVDGRQIRGKGWINVVRPADGEEKFPSAPGLER